MTDEFVFRINRKPVAKQSFEVGKNKKTGQMQAFTPTDKKRYQTEIQLEFRSQLKPPIRKLVGPLKMEITFVFAFLKSHTKAQRAMVAAGGILWKDTKPDVTDNLNKPIADALEPLIMTNDSQVAKCLSEKMYGERDCIIVRVSKLN